MASDIGPKTSRLPLFNSLKSRLILSALLLILVLMPLIGLALNEAFSVQAKNAAKNELSAYVYAVLAVTEVNHDQLQMPEVLLENQFNQIQSGLYALISTSKTTPTTVLWRSASFLGLNTPTDLPNPSRGNSVFTDIQLNGAPHLIYSFSASFEQTDPKVATASGFPITIHIVKDLNELQRQTTLFASQLSRWLIVLTALLLIVQWGWLRWTLKPLAKFKQELADIELGQANHLSTTYPAELASVAKQLNTLLQTEQNQRKRYRNALSDLAHSLKTPLAVLQSQQDLSAGAIEQVATINRMIGHQLKRAQSAAGSAWHLGIKVTSVSERLVRTLGKIYPHINIETHVDPDSIFKGDEADLTEILGNLLDNACKAAQQDVRLTVNMSETLDMQIEDDGAGICLDKQAQIFERGIRADTYQQGHGIGLAIVRDLTDSYQGKLSVGSSQALGGAQFTLSFLR